MQGYDLVALIFAREVSDPLTSLAKKIDEQLADASRRHGPNKLGVYIIFLTDDPGFGRRLPDLVAKEKLKHVVLTTFASDGPKQYKIAKEADTTIVIYENRNKVNANFALAKGGLNETISTQVLEKVSKVLPK